LLTGGARGITAAIALELGKRRNVKLHLVGTSSLPEIDPTWKTYNDEQLASLKKEIVKKAIAEKLGIPAKVWQKVRKEIEIDSNLDAFRKAGIDFAYHICDVNDKAGLFNVVKSIGGNITGVVHGAGVGQNESIEKKKLEDVQNTYNVKARGTAYLMDVLHDLKITPQVFVGFSSISGRIGSVGQTDYGGANDMVAKLCDWYDAQTDCRALSFHWPAWTDVGMANEPLTKFFLSRNNVAMLNPKEGIAHFINEVEHVLDGQNSQREREILILDWNLYKRYYPDIVVPNIKDDHSPNPVACCFVGDNADTDALRNVITELDCPELFVTAARDPRLALFGKGKLDWFITESLRQIDEWLNVTAHRTTAESTAEQSAQHCRLVVLTALADYPAGQRFVDYLTARSQNNELGNVDVEFIDLPAETAPEKVAVTAVARRMVAEDKVKLPALIRNIEKTGDSFFATGIFDPQKDRFLLEHRLNGKPILPLVAILETFAEAVNVGQQKGILPAETFTGFENIVIQQGMICRTTNPYHFKIHCTPTENGWQTELLGDFYNTAGKFVKNNLCYTKARLTFTPVTSVHEEEWNPQWTSGNGYDFSYSNQGTLMFHGQPLQYLKRIHYIDSRHCAAEVHVPDTAELFGSKALLNGAVIDAAFYACGVFYYTTQSQSYTVPRKAGRLMLREGNINPGEKCYVHITLLPEYCISGKNACFDFTIYNQAGEIVYDACQYTADVFTERNQ
jgi:NAD(P)-dependent dehydrogenase (short-subunit alcohol dehydrogenase family)